VRYRRKYVFNKFNERRRKWRSRSNFFLKIRKLMIINGKFQTQKKPKKY